MDLDEYLKNVPRHRTARFSWLRTAIKSYYPDAVESMRYKMPTFEHGDGWLAIANQKQHIALYTCSPAHIEEFKRKYPNIDTGKGCIRFRDTDEIPFDDLGAVIKSAMEFVKS